DNKVWAVMSNNTISVYQGPITSGANPITKIGPSIPTLDGNSVNLVQLVGIAPTPGGSALWISETGNHRVMRIRNPLTSLVVDVILGQTKVANNVRADDEYTPNMDLGSTDFPNHCNLGQVPPPNTGTNQTAALNMLCFPGEIS